MNRLLLAFPLLLAAGCATSSRVYQPVADTRYAAIGHDPFWMLTIGDDLIVFRTSRGEGDLHWDRTLPRTENGVRIWESGEAGHRIRVEARDGPCSGRGGQAFEHHVRASFDGGGFEYIGCGGRLVRPVRG